MESKSTPNPPPKTNDQQIDRICSGSLVPGNIPGNGRMLNPISNETTPMPRATGQSGARIRRKLSGSSFRHPASGWLIRVAAAQAGRNSTTCASHRHQEEQEKEQEENQSSMFCLHKSYRPDEDGDTYSNGKDPGNEEIRDDGEGFFPCHTTTSAVRRRWPG